MRKNELSFMKIYLLEVFFIWYRNEYLASYYTFHTNHHTMPISDTLPFHNWDVAGEFFPDEQNVTRATCDANVTTAKWQIQ